MKKDFLTGNPIDKHEDPSGGGSQRGPGGQVWELVLDRSQGLSHSDAAVLPGGAYLQVPGLASGTEVYQWVADTPHGIGYGPGGALVSTPFFPG